MHRLRSDGKFRLVAALIAATAAIGPAFPPAALCAPQDEITRHDWGIGNFKPPPRWTVRPADQPTYPQLLAWASLGTGADQAVMTLVARRLLPGTTVQKFAAEGQAIRLYPGVRDLRQQVQAIEGWGGHRVQLDGVLSGTPPRILRQLFYLNGSVGYVLTLVAPQAQAPLRLRDLEDSAGNMVALPIDAGARPALPPPPKPQPPPPSVTPASPSERPH